MRKKTIQSMELETWKIGKLMSSNNLQCAASTPPPALYQSFSFCVALHFVVLNIYGDNLGSKKL